MKKLLLSTSVLFIFAATLLPGHGLQLAQAQSLKKVTLRLAFTYNGHRSPYLLAVDKGFYKDEGLDVEVLEGKGISSSMQLVANKQDDFTIVDPPSLVLGVAQGMPIKQVALIYQYSPNVLISWKDQNIKKPADLVGKTVATLQGDTTTTMLYALLAKNGVDSKAMKIVAADAGTRNQLFLSKAAAAITRFQSDYIDMDAATNHQVDYFLYSDFGITAMGDGIVAHNDTIRSSPEVVRGVVRASLRAYQYANDHPEEAIASLLKRSPSINQTIAVEQLKMMVKFTESPDTREHGIGYSSKVRWEQNQQLMKDFGGLATLQPDVSIYFTNEFLPKR